MIRKLLGLFCSLFAALGLGGCDYFALQELKPGVSTGEQVREKLGRPDTEWRNADGSVQWEFSRQPAGIECFMATIGPDNILRALEQVLTEEHFARIQRGMIASEVRRALGKPAKEERFALKQETVWSWHIGDGPGNDVHFFTVYFNADGRVIKTGPFTETRG
jgi:outer membrane protein assembly factor BamE (lipoprotein component of BamABCDE complex)